MKGLRHGYSFPSPQTRRLQEQIGGLSATSTKLAAGTADRTHKIRDVSASGRIKRGDFVVRQFQRTASTLYLPDARLCVGRRFQIEDAAGTAFTGNITVSATLGQTINGATTALINTNYGSLVVRSTGTAWVKE